VQHVVPSLQKTITRYQTIEVPFNHEPLLKRQLTPGIHQVGIGYGGIFSLEYLKLSTDVPLHDDPNYGQFYKKYEITQISDIHGRLFPLEVGNSLSFHYTDLFQSDWKGGSLLPDRMRHGKMVYHVVKKMKGFPESQPAVPGDVYEIDVSYSIDPSDQLYPLNTYYFSTALGWYVMATYFQGNQPVVSYRLVSWR